MNSIIEQMRPDWRAKLYERVGDVPPDVVTKSPGGTNHAWEHLRWKVREGVSTANADADYKWGRKEYQ